MIRSCLPLPSRTVISRRSSSTPSREAAAPPAIPGRSVQQRSGEPLDAGHCTQHGANFLAVRTTGRRRGLRGGTIPCGRSTRVRGLRGTGTAGRSVPGSASTRSHALALARTVRNAVSRRHSGRPVGACHETAHNAGSSGRRLPRFDGSTDRSCDQPDPIQDLRLRRIGAGDLRDRVFRSGVLPTTLRHP